LVKQTFYAFEVQQRLKHAKVQFAPLHGKPKMLVRYVINVDWVAKQIHDK